MSFINDSLPIFVKKSSKETEFFLKGRTLWFVDKTLKFTCRKFVTNFSVDESVSIKHSKTESVILSNSYNSDCTPFCTGSPTNVINPCFIPKRLYYLVNTRCFEIPLMIVVIVLFLL